MEYTVPTNNSDIMKEFESQPLLSHWVLCMAQNYGGVHVVSPKVSLKGERGWGDLIQLHQALATLATE